MFQRWAIVGHVRSLWVSVAGSLRSQLGHRVVDGGEVVKVLGLVWGRTSSMKRMVLEEGFFQRESMRVSMPCPVHLAV